MTLRSMTGYGRGTAAGEGLTATVEISSVNRKQLDVVCALPRGIHLLEARIVEQIQEALSRGRVTVDVSINWSAAARRKAVRIDEALAGAYVKTLRRAASEFGLSDAISVEALLAFPDVLHFAQPQEDVERVWRVMRKALTKALRALNAMRRAEGAALQRDVATRLDRLHELLNGLRKRAPLVVKRYRRQLQDRLRAAGLETVLSDDRLLREIVLFTDRSDIQEELTRLDSHLKQAARRLRGSAAAGRSLDFLAQEMFREINTIGSKAHDAPMLQHVVEFKAELERIREQVQNIE